MTGWSDASRARHFWRRVDKTQTCWLWTGSLDSNGYGHLHWAGRAMRAHRQSWVLAGLQLPEDGAVLDHICRVRTCVRPDHLRILTNAENVLIGIGPTAINARKTSCHKGHEFTPDNTYARPDGHRSCRACVAETQAAASRRRRARRWSCSECGKDLAWNSRRNHTLTHARSA